MPCILAVRIQDHVNSDGSVRRAKGGIVDVLPWSPAIWTPNGKHEGPLGGNEGCKEFVFIRLPNMDYHEALKFKARSDAGDERGHVDWETLFDESGRAKVRDRGLKSPEPRADRVTGLTLKKGAGWNKDMPR